MVPKKRKKQIKIDMNQLARDFREYQKNLSTKQSLRFSSFEEYVDYRCGRKSNVKTAAFKSYVPKPGPYIRESQYVPSLGSHVGSVEKRTPQQYSGDYIVGIATMHKSNLVPVGREDSPRDYSTMRRN